MLTSGLVFRALASLLVGYIAMAMRPPRASPSREIHGASRDHYAPDEALERARRQDLAAVSRDQQGVLELRRQRAVGGDDRPPVVQLPHAGTTEVDHGLDGDGHALAQAQARAALPEMGNVGRLVHGAADAVTAQLAHDAAPLARGQLFDGGADVAQARAGTDRRDAGVTAAARRLDDVPRLGAGRTDEERRRGIAME